MDEDGNEKITMVVSAGFVVALELDSGFRMKADGMLIAL